mmetsp:Transcript_11961/g.17696  ORF Transcript_11961/g.17696 Transcript_11961/m.17696 type:complete len:131 (-) Transcript_11961:1191-1583(-)
MYWGYIITTWRNTLVWDSFTKNGHCMCSHHRNVAALWRAYLSLLLIRATYKISEGALTSFIEVLQMFENVKPKLDETDPIMFSICRCMDQVSRRRHQPRQCKSCQTSVRFGEPTFPKRLIFRVNSSLIDL